ncbi:hypothetical protein D3C84_1095520 [compost metagenome]
MADVVFEVETLVLQPVGVVQAQRCLGQAPAEHRGGVQAVTDVLENLLVADDAVGCGILITEPEAADDHRLVGGLEIEKMRVQRGELFHLLPS